MTKFTRFTSSGLPPGITYLYFPWTWINGQPYEGGLPMHLPCPVDKNGFGPAFEADVDREGCWCRFPECKGEWDEFGFPK